MLVLLVRLVVVACAIAMPRPAPPPAPPPGATSEPAERALPLCSATYCDDEGHCWAPSPPNCR